MDIGFDIENIEYPTKAHRHVLRRKPITHEGADIADGFKEFTASEIKRGQIPNGKTECHRRDQLLGKDVVSQIRAHGDKKLATQKKRRRDGEHEYSD